jgi:glycosyltransferase involved in cell wall biosynthesis
MAWEQAVVPFQLRSIQPDLYHSPNYILPVALSCPSVVTIHDLAFLDPSVHRLRSHLYLTALTALAVRKATRIVCVSEYTRRELEAHYPHAAGRVRVVGEGVNERFKPPTEQEAAAFRARLGFEDPYLLFVGSLEPRKNLPRLIRAYEGAIAATGAGHQLVIAGGAGWRNGPLREALRHSTLRNRIHVLGYLSEAELPAAYAGAEVFLYPSLREGFGLPPLEAMACGTPVLTSNVSAIPEVVGDAALTVDPNDLGALTDGLSRLLTDVELRKQLRDRGMQRAAEFRWDRVAAQMVQVYEEAIA